MNINKYEHRRWWYKKGHGTKTKRVGRWATKKRQGSGSRIIPTHWRLNYPPMNELSVAPLYLITWSPARRRSWLGPFGPAAGYADISWKKWRKKRPFFVFDLNVWWKSQRKFLRSFIFLFYKYCKFYLEIYWGYVVNSPITYTSYKIFINPIISIKFYYIGLFYILK